MGVKSFKTAQKSKVNSDPWNYKEGIGGLTFATNARVALNEEVVEVLTEIGYLERYRDLVAHVLVGLESGDQLTLNDYDKLVDALEPHLREKLLGAVIGVQQ